MVALGLAVLICVVGLVALARKHRQGSVLLAAFPVALLLPVLPIAPDAVGMIRGFQAISQSGNSGLAQVAAFSIGVSRPLFWGCVGFVLVMLIAAGLQLMAEPEDVADELAASPEASTTSTPQNRLSAVLLLGASLLAVPVGAIIHLVASVPRLVMSISEALSPGATIPRLPGVEVQQASEQISSRLVGSTLGGIGMTVLLIAAAGVMLWVVRPGRVPRWLVGYGWAVTAIAVIAAAWFALDLLVDLRSYERFLTAPPTVTS
jgi:hypothetical protein